MGIKKQKESFFKRIYETSPIHINRAKLNELLRVYEDLENNLKVLKRTVKRNSDPSLLNINVKKLIGQLSRSKRRLERKIGNTLLLEKQYLKKRIGNITSSILRD